MVQALCILVGCLAVALLCWYRKRTRRVAQLMAAQELALSNAIRALPLTIHCTTADGAKSPHASVGTSGYSSAVESDYGESSQNCDTGEARADCSVECDDDCCCVCLGEFADGEELRTLPCGHAFHASCIDEWLLGKGRELRNPRELPSCPMCKSVPIAL